MQLRKLPRLPRSQEKLARTKKMLTVVRPWSIKSAEFQRCLQPMPGWVLHDLYDVSALGLVYQQLFFRAQALASTVLSVRINVCVWYERGKFIKGAGSEVVYYDQQATDLFWTNKRFRLERKPNREGGSYTLDSFYVRYNYTVNKVTSDLSAETLYRHRFEGGFQQPK